MKLALAALSILVLPGAIQAQTPVPRCDTPEHRQFDFWAGEWDGYDVDAPDKLAATVRVERVLGGCVLHEVYEGTNGVVGQSFSIYDAGRRAWHQTWVTNRGQLLLVGGRLQGDVIVFEGTNPDADGRPIAIRVDFIPQDGTVRQTARTSADGGKTWQPLFDMVFRRRSRPADDGRRAVAALDTRYQDAVKRNDAETMERILHADFVLVLGNGKTYTRDDLLTEARKRTIEYERQDEDEGTQTVRVWGDTAVVTARLWIKGVRAGVAFDRRLWFSDTYVRTAQGWRYAFGQASLALPSEAPAAPSAP